MKSECIAIAIAAVFSAVGLNPAVAQQAGTATPVRETQADPHPATAGAIQGAPADEQGPDASGIAGAGQKPQQEAHEGDAKEPQKALVRDGLTDDEFKGSWPMFGTNLRMKVGGYMKADAVADFDGSLDRTQFLMSTIPIEGTPEHGNAGYFYMFARETRFNIDVRRASPGALPLRMFVEGDFWSTGNQFRLRHAYLAAGNFTVGQTWTTLSFLEVLPFMIDFAAGDALFGGRTTQVRFQKKLSDRWKLAVGLENLDFLGIENPANLPGKPSAALPLLAVRADLKWSSGLLLMGSSVGQLRWDGGATGPRATAMQLDGAVGVRQNLGKRDFVAVHVSYGVGSGENIIAFAGSQANAVLTPDGRFDTMPAFSLILGYTHNWTPKLTSVAVYAYGWLETSRSRAPLSLKEGGIGHVNLVWRPVAQLATGVEYMWGTSRVANQALGSARRAQWMAMFSF